MTAIVNYGLGNIGAFADILKKNNFDFKIALKPEDLQSVSRIILPGVGHFDYAMQQLKEIRNVK